MVVSLKTNKQTNKLSAWGKHHWTLNLLYIIFLVSELASAGLRDCEPSQLAPKLNVVQRCIGCIGHREVSIAHVAVITEPVSSTTPRVCFTSFYNAVLRIVLFKEHPPKYLLASFLVLFNIFVSFLKKNHSQTKEKLVFTCGSFHLNLI